MQFLKSYLPLNTPDKILQLIQTIKKEGLLTDHSDDFVNQVCLHIRKKKLQMMFREKIYPLIISSDHNKVKSNQKKADLAERSSRSDLTISLKNSSEIESQLVKPKRPRINQIEKKSVTNKAKETTQLKKNKDTLSNLNTEQSNRNDSKYRHQIIKSKNNKCNKENESTNINIPSFGKFVPEKAYSDDITIFFIKHIFGKSFVEIAKALNIHPNYLSFILQKRKVKSENTLTIGDFDKIKVDITPLIKTVESNKPVENKMMCKFAMRYNQRFSPTYGKEGNYYKLIYNKPKQ